MRLEVIGIVVGLLLVSGCSGVTFAPANVNEPIPDAFKKRALYPAGVAGYEFQDLVGNVLIIQNNEDPLRVGIIRPSGYENVVIPITDPNNYYRSRIQKGAETQGSYLAFSANFSSDQMAELTLVDIARSGIVFEDENTWNEIIGKAVKWVKSNPRSSSQQKRLWVKSVVLSRRVYHSHTKIDANADGQVGDVTGVKTGVYRKSEEGIKSVMLGFEAFDIDRLATHVGNKSIESISPDNVLDTARFEGVLKGEIIDAIK